MILSDLFSRKTPLAGERGNASRHSTRRSLEPKLSANHYDDCSEDLPFLKLDVNDLSSHFTIILPHTVPSTMAWTMHYEEK